VDGSGKAVTEARAAGDEAAVASGEETPAGAVGRDAAAVGEGGLVEVATGAGCAEVGRAAGGGVDTGWVALGEAQAARENRITTNGIKRWEGIAMSLLTRGESGANRAAFPTQQRPLWAALWAAR
jgi:hypothetical protein